MSFSLAVSVTSEVYYLILSWRSPFSTRFFSPRFPHLTRFSTSEPRALLSERLEQAKTPTKNVFLQGQNAQEKANKKIATIFFAFVKPAN